MPPVKLSLLLIVLAALMPHGCCASAVTHFSARRWHAKDGLPHNAVIALAQSRDGYLWVGTADGLAKFDGFKFTSVDFESVAGRGNRSVTALCSGLDGSLWAGTSESGLLRLKEGRWTHFRQTNGLAGDSIKTLLGGRDGCIWIGTTNGLSRFQDEQFQSIPRESGLANNVRFLSEDRNGSIWIAVNREVTCFENGSFVSYALSPGAGNGLIRAIAKDAEGKIWWGSFHGLGSVDANGKSAFYDKQRGLADNGVTTLFLDSAGNFWIGTFGGLNRKVDGGFVTELNNTGVSYDQINAIMEDSEGNVWVGTRDGLFCLTPKPFITYSRQHGLSHNNVMSIYENKPGHFWIATWGGGLNWMHDGIVETFSTTRNRTNRLGSDHLLALHKDRRGYLWIGTDFSGGLFELDHGTFAHYGPGEGLTNFVIRAMCEDRNRTLWLGTGSGLVRYDNGVFRCYTTEQGLAGNTIRAIIPGQPGTLWIGTETGLSFLAADQSRNYTRSNGLSDDFVFALYRDKADDLWIGTQRGGLNRFRHGKFTSYTTAQGLFQNEILEIVEDDRGFLWMSTLKGVFRVNKRELDEIDAGKLTSVTCTTYGQGDGMLSAQCNGIAKPAAWKGHDGRLWFATIKGVAVVDPNFNRTNQVPPPVFIEQVVADKKVQRVQNEGSLEPRMLNLPPGRGEIEFYYTAIGFRDPERVRFKCKLKGVDSDWVDAGMQRSARYNNLLPGRYDFRVIACNNDGLWNEDGARIAFFVQPHFWQTWWFKLSMAFVSLSIAAAGARAVTKKKMLLKLERLEQQNAIEKERTRIAQDMHDDLGARLTEMLLLSQRVEGIAGKEEAKNISGTLSETAREVAGSINAIVWAVNPGNDSLDKMTSYLVDYALKYLGRSSIKCELDVSDELPELAVSSEIRHNIFLVFKEALNNAVKHAAASRVRLRVCLSGENLLFEIEDDGRGFALETNNPGNGLGNMRKRMEDVDGLLDLTSERGKGTRIRLQIPIRKYHC